MLDATLDQTGLAPPMAIEIPDPRWWAGQWPIFVPIAGGNVRYTEFPGRGSYKSAPDFRPRRRREIVRDVIEQVNAIENDAKDHRKTHCGADCAIRPRRLMSRPTRVQLSVTCKNNHPASLLTSIRSLNGGG